MKVTFLWEKSKFIDNKRLEATICVNKKHQLAFF
ncbi:hypothetical protein SAMN05421675_0037 [Pasteurella multocida]|nr:hypothetical protein PmVP161_0481 [Pasteurella multocida]VEE38224.1 Uncharacterised protein [Pasteurella multocida subsp. gallicida]TAA76332.1 hypothetical protein PMCNF_20800 [Pasteurella multocida]TAA76472.1 hypothetical protein PMCND_21220 [Pasteurella multocida]TAA85448.1 hypothetical protein PMCNB_20760 [Pasteurella multocida]